MQNKYSDLKLLHFPEKLDSFKSGAITAPIYVRVKPINLCNHHCWWCLGPDTLIDMADGTQKPIKDIRPGDRVAGLDGTPNTVTEVSRRTVDRHLEVSCNGQAILTSEEHPFLTNEGWVNAKHLRTGDRAVMRLRPWKRDQAEPRMVEHLPDGATHLDRSLVLRPIAYVRKIDRPLTVFNFSCEPGQSYVANGFAVHNCVYHSPEMSQMHKEMETRDRIPLGKMREILDDFADMGVKALTYSGGGEPLIHPDIVTIMEHTLARGIDLSIITNGSMLNGDRAAVLRNAKWVRVSMDYSCKEELLKFRKVHEKFYDEIMANIEAFARSKPDTCDLYVNYIVHAENCSNLFRVALNLKSIGVQNVRFSPMWVSPGFHEYHAKIADKVVEQLQRIKAELADHQFSVNTTYDLTSSAHNNFRTYKKCYFMQTVPVIGADQVVYACHNKAYDSTGAIGSIKDRSFKDLWFSQEAKQIFDGLNPVTTCCHQCSNDSKNILITELLNTSVDNFV